jgi:hypothetical protein
VWKRAAIKRLPSFLPTEETANVLRATGTDAQVLQSDNFIPNKSSCSKVAYLDASESDSLTTIEHPSIGEGGVWRKTKPLATQGVESGCDSLTSIDLRAGDGARTHDSHVGNAETENARDNSDKDLGKPHPALTLNLHTDPDFTRLANAWQDLPAPIRRAVMALIDASAP